MITNIKRRAYTSGKVLEFKTDRSVYIFCADTEHDITVREIQIKFTKQNYTYIEGQIDLDQAPKLVMAQFNKMLMLQ